MIVSATEAGRICCWEVATGEEIQSFNGHTEPVGAVAFSPDGKFIASAAQDKICLWDVTTGEEIRSIECFYSVSEIAFLPDGHTIVVVFGSRGVSVFEIVKGEERELVLRQSGPTQLGYGRRTSSRVIALSPDGRRIAWADLGRTIWLQDTSIGEVQEHIGPLTFFIGAMTFSPDGRLLASVNDRYGLNVWDAMTGEKIGEFDHAANSIMCIAFSPDNKTLALALYRSTVELWSLKIVQESQDCGSDVPEAIARRAGRDEEDDSHEDGHTRMVTALAFSPDGKKVASASLDRTVRHWDAATGKAMEVLSHPGIVDSVVFSSDSRNLVSLCEDRLILVWDVASGEERNRFNHDDKVKSVLLSPNGKVVASVVQYIVRLWDVTTGEETQELRHDEGVGVIAFSPDSKTLASTSRGAIHLWDVVTGEEKQKLASTECPDGSFDALTFSLAGKALAAAITTKTPIWTGTSWIARVAFDLEYTVWLWDIVAGSSKEIFHTKEVSFDKLAVSTDADMVAAALCLSKTIRLWDGTRIREVEAGAYFYELSFSPDNRYLLTDRGSLSIESLDEDSSIFLSSDWIIQGETKLLWLPPAYREFRSACYGNTIVLGYESGRVMFIRLGNFDSPI
jgi:WD40 repeat protein